MRINKCYNSYLRHGTKFDCNLEAMLIRGARLLIDFNAFQKYIQFIDMVYNLKIPTTASLCGLQQWTKTWQGPRYEVQFHWGEWMGLSLPAGKCADCSCSFNVFFFSARSKVATFELVKNSPTTVKWLKYPDILQHSMTWRKCHFPYRSEHIENGSFGINITCICEQTPANDTKNPNTVVQNRWFETWGS